MRLQNKPYPSKTSVHIISVIDNVILTTNNTPMGALNEYYVQAARKALKTAKNALGNAEKVWRTKNPTLTITKAVNNGSRKSVILGEAETFGTDLIIVCSHGFGVVKRFLLGSVSQALALHAKCSVEIVRIKNNS